MANQVFSPKMSGKPYLMGDKRVFGLVILAIVIMGLFLVLALNLGQKDLANSIQSNIEGAMVNNLRANTFSTQQYWDMAREHAAKANSTVVTEEPAYYTEKYWNLAKKATVAEPQGFSTQQYWDMAREHAAKANASVVTEEPAYYTEKYWNLAKKATVAEPERFSTEQYWELARQRESQEKEYAYYTERYWDLSENR